MSMLREFRDFSMRGSVVDLAVGFTVGAAFTTIVKSLVQDIIMPPVGLLIGKASFENLFLVLRPGEGAAGPYATLAAAREAAAVTLNYGVFLNNLAAFMVLALVMFGMIRGVNRVNQMLEEEFSEVPPVPEDRGVKKCPHCLSTVAFKATRCAHCTSELRSGSAS